MTTRYGYHRTPNDRIVWTPNVIYYVTSKPSNALYDGKRLGQIIIYPYGNQTISPVANIFHGWVV